MSDILAVVTERIDIISANGPQGIQGIPGVAGSLTLTEYVAGDTTAAYHAVLLDSAGVLRYASQSDLTHVGRVLGITVTNAAQGESCVVKNFNKITNPSWNWLPNQPIFLGVNGVITQSVPGSTAAFLMVLGFPINATTLFVSLRDPIILSA